MTTGIQQHLYTQFDERQWIMWPDEKKSLFLSVFCLQSAFSVLQPHAILSLFSPLHRLTCWLTPPPLLLFFLSGWYVPRTKSMDGENRNKRRAGGNKKRGGERRRHLQENSFPVHVLVSLCCSLVQWYFLKSEEKNLAVLTSRKKNQNIFRHHFSTRIQFSMSIRDAAWMQHIKRRATPMKATKACI